MKKDKVPVARKLIADWRHRLRCKKAGCPRCFPNQEHGIQPDAESHCTRVVNLAALLKELE